MHNKIITVILLIIFCISGTVLVREYFYSQPPEEVEPAAPVEEDPVKLVSQLAGYEELNADTIGYIDIADTEISFPVVQTDNNDYYLSHNFDGTQNKFGSIFADYLNAPDFTDQNTVIYGHNLNKPGMFYSLNEFRDQQYTDEHKFITIKLPFETLTYQIFSVYVTEPNYPYRVVNYSDNADYQAFLTQCQERSLITGDATVTTDDTLLTLSTCVYDFKDARLAIHAVLIEREAIAQ